MNDNNYFQQIDQLIFVILNPVIIIREQNSNYYEISWSEP